MSTIKRLAVLAAAFGLLAASSGAALAQKKYDTGATDTEIKIGNIMPYSGPASAYGVIGKTEAAYFKRSEEHTSELQSQSNLVCRLLLEKKKQVLPHFLANCLHSVRDRCLIKFAGMGSLRAGYAFAGEYSAAPANDDAT